MGGKGSGGMRVGSGRKPKDAKAAFLHGKSRGQMVCVSSSGGNIVAGRGKIAVPGDLTTEQREVWLQLAPHALDAGTLTAGTAMAFRQLCGRIVLLHQMEAMIAADGLMGVRVNTQMDEDGGGSQVVEKKAHDLLTKCMTLMQRVDQGMIRFRLSPIGKEITAQEQPVDPFSEFDGDTIQ